MIDKDAISAVQAAVGIEQASDAFESALRFKQPAIPLHNHFKIEDLEKYMPRRRRARGQMCTTVLAHFKDYVEAHKEEGATVFVAQDEMCATAVLNLGTPTNPGHADNLADFDVEQTAEYRALRRIADGELKTQAEVAEFMEDWAPAIVRCASDPDSETAISLKHAIAAVRQLTIESIRKLENAEGNLSASRSTFDSVQVTNQTMPGYFEFLCHPSAQLSSRQFSVRVGVLTGEAKPKLKLRIIKDDWHQEEMSAELAGMVSGAFAGTIPVVIGSYKAK